MTILNVGTRLKELRKEKGMTQKELSEKIHLSRQTISKWETNNSLPDIQTLILLAEIFETTVLDILNEDEQILTAQTPLSANTKEKYLSFNDERRKEEMIDKRTKKFLLICMFGFLLLSASISGKTLYDNYQNKIEEESYKVYLYGVSDIIYGKEKTIIGSNIDYVKTLVLDDDSILKEPTMEDISNNGLLEKNGAGKFVYKGTIINYYKDSDQWEQ